MVHFLPQDATLPRKRNAMVMYAVGMSVVLETGPQDLSKSLCVITDWADKCPEKFHWTVKYQDMDLPFYCVILENGDTTYVSQGNISQTKILISILCLLFLPGQIIAVDSSPKLMDDDKIGIHFSEFNGFYYVGNQGKKKSYPGDEDYKAKFFHI